MKVFYTATIRVSLERDVPEIQYSLKTEIVMTMNLREWRHFFKLRCAKAAHPQMREVANMILDEFKSKIPVVFDDIEER